MRGRKKVKEEEEEDTERGVIIRPPLVLILTTTFVLSLFIACIVNQGGEVARACESPRFIDFENLHQHLGDRNRPQINLFYIAIQIYE